MKRLLTCLALMVCCLCTALAQQNKQGEQTQKMLDAAANNGRAAPTDMTVKHNVNAQAVLIPQTDAPLNAAAASTSWKVKVTFADRDAGGRINLQ